MRTGGDPHRAQAVGRRRVRAHAAAAVLRDALAIACLPFCIGLCHAQTFPPDTDSFDAAVASMKVVELTADLLGGECSARVPGLGDAIGPALNAWRQNNLRAIGRADAYWAALANAGAAGDGLEPMRATVRATVDKLAAASVPATGAPAPLAAYCRRYFDRLGEWRSRTPRLHRILDEQI
jgi:hypothetical protein